MSDLILHRVAKMNEIEKSNTLLDAAKEALLAMEEFFPLVFDGATIYQKDEDQMDNAIANLRQAIAHYDFSKQIQEENMNQDRITQQDIKNLFEFFDGFCLTVKDVIYYTGLPPKRAEEVHETICKIRNTKQ